MHRLSDGRECGLPDGHADPKCRSVAAVDKRRIINRYRQAVYQTTAAGILTKVRYNATQRMTP